jgi:hypothetical protein
MTAKIKLSRNVDKKLFLRTLLKKIHAKDPDIWCDSERAWVCGCNENGDIIEIDVFDNSVIIKSKDKLLNYPPTFQCDAEEIVEHVLELDKNPAMIEVNHDEKGNS